MFTSLTLECIMNYSKRVYGMTKFIFDIDGTLTPSRSVINEAFGRWLYDFMRYHDVYFVTGSDSDKTIEQVGEDLFRKVQYSFNCSGNCVFQNGNVVYRNDWECPDDLWMYLEDQLYRSKYQPKYGKNFEPRIGMLNFSIVGRQAVGDQRKQYYEWDLINKERERLADYINQNWPEVTASVGGETGIDIFPKGKDKAQILDWFDEKDHLIFFGDRIDPNGNDWTLARKIVDNDRGLSYNVKDYKETWDILKDYD
jgi:phosphomannomutase